ncbi:hypothetical protein FGIG_00038 [Fasciola gigantica]|uniref:Uncharacterized protein n=1 Tax=Fasciola gigantica TaxID=46835 RepID=A0A504XSI8_FASGI|nr:hypothetical protein FGIG_00038 [Fasciola gigantica]
MQSRLAEIAPKKQREGIKLLFRCLVLYPEESLSTFFYCYGRRNGKLSQWMGDADTRHSYGVRRRITVIAGRLDGKCPVCYEDHDLESWSKFLSISFKVILEVTRDAARCFKRLNPGHRAVACHTVSRCLELNCYGRHHTLVHVLRLPSTPAKANIASVNREVPHTFKGFVMVRLLRPRGSEETYAFLNND